MNEKIKNKKSLIFDQKTEHYTAASSIIHFPDLDIPEVCFAGRSNVGKSSLINITFRSSHLWQTLVSHAFYDMYNLKCY